MHRMKLVHTALAAALAFAAAPAYAQTYTQTIFFGDSLTDSGTFRPALVQQGGPLASVLGRFTTNPGPVWAEYLAQYYGTNGQPANQGGTNFAVGGARVGVNSASPFGTVPSLQTQVSSYLTANGGRADPGALYTVWGGANDLFAIAAGAPAQATLGAAVGAQVGIVGSLTNAGARYILVPTVPDMGLTPAARAQGPAAQAQFTTLAATYNTALFNGLAANNLRVIPLDTFNLLREVVANPAAFGILNVTGTACQPQITAQSLTCSSRNFVTPDAATTYLFADGVHPSSVTHQVLGDFAVSILEAPRQVALLTHTTATVGRARADRVDSQATARGISGAEGMRWWADVRGDFQRYENGVAYDSVGPALTVGADWRSGNLVTGVFGGFGRSDIDWGRDGGQVKQGEATLGGYLGWRSGAAWLNGQLSYTQLDFDTDRRVKLGIAQRSHQGATDGANLTAGIEAGWEFGSGALRHGPLVGVLAQRIDIDGFAEDQPTLSTSLAYPDQQFDSLIGKAGWQVRYQGERAAPYARLTYDREFEDTATEAFARSQSMPATRDYAVPAVQFDDGFATLQAGVRMKMFGLNADMGASVSAARARANESSVFLTLGSAF